MTYLIDDAHTGHPMLHVLVVGVEAYDADGGFRTLEGVADAAVDLARWWVQSHDRMLPTLRLGSVRLLLSAVQERHVDTPTGKQVPDRPTRAGVQQALEAWIGRCAAGGVGVLCWTGHGEASGAGGMDALETLFCCDTWDGRQRGIAWDRTLNAINTRSGSARICCFIDACRSEDPDPDEHPAGIEGGRVRNLARRAFVNHGTALGGTAWSFPDPLPGAGFPGGPLATRALLDALDQFGGIAVSRSLGTCATPEGIGQAVAARVARWARWIAAEEGEEVEVVPGHVPGHNYRDHLIKVPQPVAMIDVHPEPGVPIGDLGCEIRAADTTDRAHTAAPETHECDVDHAAYHVRLWSLSTGDGIWNGTISADRPLVEIRP